MKPLLAAMSLILSCSLVHAEKPTRSASDGAEVCRERVEQLLGAVSAESWDRLAAVIDGRTREHLDLLRERSLKTDHDGLMKFLSEAMHPGRARRHIRVEPLAGSSTHFRVVQTGPYTYIDAPMESPADPCGHKPVELCVELVTDESGVPRLRLTYALHDILYLLQ